MLKKSLMTYCAAAYTLIIQFFQLSGKRGGSGLLSGYRRERAIVWQLPDMFFVALRFHVLTSFRNRESG